MVGGTNGALPGGGNLLQAVGESGPGAAVLPVTGVHTCTFTAGRVPHLLGPVAHYGVMTSNGTILVVAPVPRL